MAERISNEEWHIMKEHYIREFDGMKLDIEWMEGMLDKSWEMWNAGEYSSIDKFVEELDEQFQKFADLLKDKDE